MTKRDELREKAIYCTRQVLDQLRTERNALMERPNTWVRHKELAGLQNDLALTLSQLHELYSALQELQRQICYEQLIAEVGGYGGEQKLELVR